MLKVKNLTHLSKKKLKKSWNFDHGCKKNRALLDFNPNFVLYRMNVISGR